MNTQNTPMQNLLNYIDTMPFNGSKEHSDLVNVIEQEFKLIEKDFAKHSFEMGAAKGGELIWNKENNCNANNAQDFETYYKKFNQL